MDKFIQIVIDDWEFIFEHETKDYPLGYYLHKPTTNKYSFKFGIKHIVGTENEQKIYDMWWLTN